jgi:hypothetical protein
MLRGSFSEDRKRRRGEHCAVPSELNIFGLPDALDHFNAVLAEVKNYSGTVRLTNQIKDFVLYSIQNGYRFVLYVADPSKVSNVIQELVRDGVII